MVMTILTFTVYNKLHINGIFWFNVCHCDITLADKETATWDSIFYLYIEFLRYLVKEINTSKFGWSCKIS